MTAEERRLVAEASRRLRKQLRREPAEVKPPGPPTTLEPEPAPLASGDAQTRVDAWFARHGMRPFGFQREVWARYRAGESGLLHASTGTGKTLAAWLGVVMEALDEIKPGSSKPVTPR
jgi:ATP-dependent Lhr-like helicase